MKQIIKSEHSKILEQNLKYSKPNDRKKIVPILIKEQFGFCVYTEYPINSVAVAVDIEHFKPKSKFPNEEDNYENWFAASHHFNIKKSSKWKDEMLYPTDEYLENRLYYNKMRHSYYAKSNDIAAKNLIALVDLNNFELVNERKNYIQNLRNEIDNRGYSINEVFKYGRLIMFRRAIKACFPDFNGSLNNLF